MELVQGVSLLSFLKARPQKKIVESDCKYIFSQIMKGIDYLHSKNIFHRDIKLENIIIDETNSLKIIDFGFGTCNPQSRLLNFFCGTPSYMPPEIIQKKDYIGPFADIWSLGILLYTLLSGSFPFRGIIFIYINFLQKNIGLSEKELYTKITKGNFCIPDDFSFDVKNLIKRILVINPANRINSSNVSYL
jgi:serine/threonine protein kinase